MNLLPICPSRARSWCLGGLRTVVAGGTRADFIRGHAGIITVVTGLTGQTVGDIHAVRLVVVGEHGARQLAGVELAVETGHAGFRDGGTW